MWHGLPTSWRGLHLLGKSWIPRLALAEALYGSGDTWCRHPAGGCRLESWPAREIMILHRPIGNAAEKRLTRMYKGSLRSGGPPPTVDRRRGMGNRSSWHADGAVSSTPVTILTGTLPEVARQQAKRAKRLVSATAKGMPQVNESLGGDGSLPHVRHLGVRRRALRLAMFHEH